MDQQMTVMVTGASAGMGEATVRRFIAEGHRVIATARRLERLESLAEELGGDLLPVGLDVQDRPAIESALADLPDRFADIDVLVNNAGLALGLEPAQEASLDKWEQMLQTNCGGLMACTRLVLPGMVERGRGHVINIGSTAGTHPYPNGNVYAATKAFVHQFSLGLRADLFGTGVRVTCVEPGMADTEFSTVRFGGDRASADALYAGWQALTAEDVAESVYWSTQQPQHVNVNVIELTPTAQVFAGMKIFREEA